MANAFKCDVCGRLIEGRPHEVEGWAALALAQPAKPRYDSIKCTCVVELCEDCLKGAEASLKAFTAERRRQVGAIAAEMVQIATNLNRHLDRPLS